MYPYGWWGRGRGYRWMYWLTGLPGWMRFGFSPGWVGVSPTGLPPGAQYILSTGQLPQFTQFLQTYSPSAGLTADQEKQILTQQFEFLKQQLEAIKKRLEELEK
ncbi:MAG: DUF5320 domain-containing protein [Candidatus Odinarchaeia archaeon]